MASVLTQIPRECNISSMSFLKTQSSVDCKVIYSNIGHNYFSELFFIKIVICGSQDHSYRAKIVLEGHLIQIHHFTDEQTEVQRCSVIQLVVGRQGLKPRLSQSRSKTLSTAPYCFPWRELVPGWLCEGSNSNTQSLMKQKSQAGSASIPINKIFQALSSPKHILESNQSSLQDYGDFNHRHRLLMPFQFCFCVY